MMSEKKIERKNSQTGKPMTIEYLKCRASQIRTWFGFERRHWYGYMQPDGILLNLENNSHPLYKFF